MADDILLRPQLLPASASSEQVAGLLELWLGQVKRTSAKTYRAALEAFARDMKLSLEAAVAALFAGPREAAILAQTWRKGMLANEAAPKTINTRLAALRSLVKFAAADLHLISWQLLVRDIKAARIRDTRGPGTDGFKQLYAATLTDNTPTMIRDRVIVRMLFSMGLRRFEVQALNVEHVEHCENLNAHPASRLWIIAKGKHERESVALPPRVRRDLSGWLQLRHARRGPLFIAIDRWGNYGDRLCLDSYNLIVARLAERAGMLHARPHGLRHAAITEACRQTGDIQKVKEFSRHRDLNTVGLYLDALMDEQGEVARGVDLVDD